MSAIHAFWRRLDRPGHDTARLAPAGAGWLLEGYAAFDENGPTGLHYDVELTGDFRTVKGSVSGHRLGQAFRHLVRRTDDGWWLDGRAVEGLGDLVHLDFGFTPATNLQQLLHADLAVGEAAAIPAVWFDIGQPTLVRLPQHYRRVAADRYAYSSPATGYAAELELAASGFVRRYPGLWEMEPSE